MKLAFYFFVITAVIVVGQPSIAQEKQTSRYVLPDDPEKAWAEVEKVHEALRPPSAWEKQKPNPEELAKFQKEVCESALLFAEKAREFIQRFPKSENIGDARFTVIHALNHAAAAGDPNAEKRVATFVDSILADKT